MVTNQRILLIGAVAVIAILLGTALLSGIINPNILSTQSFQTPNGKVTIPIPPPDAPQNLTRYRVVMGVDTTAYYSNNNLEGEIRYNVTSEADAPFIVPKALEKYGGLPEDAIMISAETGYLEEHQDSGIPFIPSRVVAKYPISTDVQYGRKINGVPVTGEGSFIKIILGNDGELLYLNKVWRTVEPAGTEKIIPISQAIEKLGRGEVLNPLKCICDINVDRIYIAYWEKGAGVQQEYLDPVWVFSGTTSSGDVINYKVYARDDTGSSGTALSGLSGLHSAPDAESLSSNLLTSGSGNVNYSGISGNQS
jgi:hypothetical protein